MYKLLIIDDEPLVQAGIRSMLDWKELDIEICSIASNGRQGYEMILRENPDIVLTDIKMPLMDGLELIKKVRSEFGKNHPAFIILTSYEDFSIAKEAIGQNVTGYLVKIDLTPDTLKEAVTKAKERLEEYPESAPQTGIDTNYNKKDIDTLRNNFFIRLLHNILDSKDQFLELKNDLNITFDSRLCRCCYYEMINPKAEEMTVEDQVKLYSNSMHMLNENILRFQRAFFAVLDRKHGCIIFLLDKSIPSEDLIELMKEQSRILSSYYSTRLCCGLGNEVDSPLMLSVSFTNAKKALEFLDGSFNIYTPDIDEGLKASGSEGYHHTVEDVKKYIDSHLGERLTLNEVSALFGISPGYLSQLFKKYNDQGFSDYITLRRVDCAKQMMKRGNLKIYEIADALGFENAFYFSKVFKKVEGISPTKYLNKLS
ncbi:MAG: response regulator [Lachnospiraceae bacterium]|nr:response regulator [Lachnospiraceae bacterium]